LIVDYCVLSCVFLQYLLQAMLQPQEGEVLKHSTLNIQGEPRRFDCIVRQQKKSLSSFEERLQRANIQRVLS
jgi:hypothetical protein